jgi:CheY-like chemotaxis protein
MEARVSNVILLIEDSPSDAELTIRGLKRLANPIVWVKSPTEALDYLKKAGDDLPLILLLDLVFPGESSGLDLLRHIRRVPEWKDLKVVILTQDATEAPRAYAHKIEQYMVKPGNLAKLMTLIHNMEFVFEIMKV